MTSLRLRFHRSFYIRQGLVGGMLLFFCLVMVLTMKQAGALRYLAFLVFVGPWLFLVSREYFLAVSGMDEAGVTRRDGRRFLWTELHAMREVHMHLHAGQPGPLNHLDLLFAGGKARILFRVLENGWEGMEYAKKKAAERLAGLRGRLCFLIAREARRRPAGSLTEVRREICCLIAQEIRRRSAGEREWTWREPVAPGHGERKDPPAWPERREW